MGYECEVCGGEPPEVSTYEQKDGGVLCGWCLDDLGEDGPTLDDIDGPSWPNAILSISCDHSCRAWRVGNHSGPHRYMGYTKLEALELWREEHNRLNGVSK